MLLPVLMQAMLHVRRLLQRMLRFRYRRADQRPALGRWQLHSKEAVSRKVDLSNHDHCGGELCAKVPRPTKLSRERIVKNLISDMKEKAGVPRP